jgi:hypothetical protein
MTDVKPITTDAQAIEDEFHSTNATNSNVASSTSNVTLLSANSDRKGYSLFNDSTANCFVKLGTTASSTSFFLKMAAGSFYEDINPTYRGRIDAIWDAANGFMRVTEKS